MGKGNVMQIGYTGYDNADIQYKIEGWAELSDIGGNNRYMSLSKP